MAKIIYGVSDIDTMMTGKQDELTAGTGIDITNNVISVTATGGMTAHTFASFTELANALISNTNHVLIMKDNQTQIQIHCSTYYNDSLGEESFAIKSNGVTTSGSTQFIFYSYRAIGIDMNASAVTSVSTSRDEVRINVSSGNIEFNTYSQTFTIADFVAYY